MHPDPASYNGRVVFLYATIHHMEKSKYTPKDPKTKKDFVKKTNKSEVKRTTWGHVADWYDEHLLGSDTYHEKVILPNILRLLDLKKTDTVLDLPSGQGFFSIQIARTAKKVIAVDIAAELIAHAKRGEEKNITYIVSPSHRLKGVESTSVDKIAMILGIQNIEKVSGTFAECKRVLRKDGELHIVMNHPAFRIPRASSWEWDTKRQRQYRRVDEYLSESRVAIDMHPGKYVKKDEQKEETISFHRPLQFYFKLLGKNGFAVDRLEEWISHRTSDSGSRKDAENKARREFPLFLYLRALKQN
jgi:ubiquinone/menaquinone biosynthesis C-methylase UbiE